LLGRVEVESRKDGGWGWMISAWILEKELAESREEDTEEGKSITQVER